MKSGSRYQLNVVNNPQEAVSEGNLAFNVPRGYGLVAQPRFAEDGLLRAREEFVARVVELTGEFAIWVK